MSRIILIALSITVTAASPAAAQHSPATAAEFMKCARIAGDAQRLSCYDRLAVELIELGMARMGSDGGAPATGPAQVAQTPAASGPAEPPAAVSGAVTAADPEPEAAGNAGDREADAPESDSTAAQVDQPPGGTEVEEEFGRERTKQASEGSLKKIRSRYVGEFTGWDGDTVFTLENGQVWQQIESGRMSWRATNPMITIKRGFMGSYQLSVEGVNRRIRVKRIR